MPVNDELGKRMKEFYEQVPKTRLMRRCPVAIRIDGRAFHTFTRGFEKPFDFILMRSMQETMKYLCENIQGCVFGYTQSDEITLILIDYQTFASDAWFDYEIQKICSIAASMATMKFNQTFSKNAEQIIFRNDDKDEYVDDGNGNLTPTEAHYAKILSKAIEKGAMFDARCFNIPKEEVGNLIYWRQLDATRNSIQMVGQANFSHKELQGKSCNMIQDMLLTQKDINWNDYLAICKRGTACIKQETFDETEIPAAVGKPRTLVVHKTRWILDQEMPILKDDWNYINQFIYVGEN